MSRVPMGISRVAVPGSNPFGQGMKERYPERLVPQGISAELIGRAWGFAYIELDEFSAASHGESGSGYQRGALR